jgi:tetratricopeptide (TPR) repeat protein
MHRDEEWEAVRWIALIAIASAVLAVLLVSVLAAAEEPQRLSPNVGQQAEPMEPTPAALSDPLMAPRDLGVRLWEVLETQRSGQLHEAIEQWYALPLPAETDFWRNIAVGAAYMEQGQLKQAADSLELARQYQMHHPLVHYYTGLLRLEQAARAYEWEEAVGQPNIRLAAYHGPQDLQPTPVTVPDVVPNSKGMYRLAAMHELQQAIEFAPSVAMNAWLIPDRAATDSMLRPTVGDLLLVLGADRFEANAHNMLGNMYLQDGMLDQARDHMDAAAAQGVQIIFGYSALGDAYAARGHSLAAAGAYSKAMRHEGASEELTRKYQAQLRKGIDQVW